jgi:hypothetical protein
MFSKRNFVKFQKVCAFSHVFRENDKQHFCFNPIQSGYLCPNLDPGLNNLKANRVKVTVAEILSEKAYIRTKK